MVSHPVLGLRTKFVKSMQMLKGQSIRHRILFLVFYDLGSVRDTLDPPRQIDALETELKLVSGGAVLLCDIDSIGAFNVKNSIVVEYSGFEMRVAYDPANNVLERRVHTGAELTGDLVMNMLVDFVLLGMRPAMTMPGTTSVPAAGANGGGKSA